MNKRRTVRYAVTGMVVALAAAGLVTAHNASAALRPVSNRPAVVPPGLFPDVVYDIDFVSATYRHDPSEDGAYYEVTFINNGTLSIGAAFPLAPSYSLTESVVWTSSSPMPERFNVSCRDRNRPDPKTCTTTFQDNWRVGQTRTFRGPGREVSPAEEGARLNFSMTITGQRDPDGTSGTLTIAPE